MNERDDITLVAACRNGDQAAFGALFDRYAKTMYNVSLRIVGDTDGAADIVQTVFLKVLEQIDSYDDRYKFFSWIYKITVNCSINWSASQKQRVPISEHQLSEDDPPDETLEKNEHRHAIDRVLQELKEEYRTVIVLKHLQGCSYEEIAEILTIPEKTVKSRLFTARKQLKEILEKFHSI